MNKSKITLLATSLFLGILIFGVGKAEAASLYLNPIEKQVKLGEVFPIEVLLDAQEENINAMEVKVGASGGFLKLKDWSDGGSIINYWAEKPFVDESGILKFQGVVIDGFEGKGGKLLTLYYESLKPGRASVSMGTSTVVYLNDGKGTKAKLALTGAKINISKEKSKGNIISIIDITPPETLEAKISNSKDIFDGQWFLAFAANDNGSGMDYIEVKEGDSPWVRAESPYLLINQKLDQNILIKAVDKNGNERVETLNLEQYQLIRNIIYLVAFIIIVLAAWQILRRRKFKKGLA